MYRTCCQHFRERPSGQGYLVAGSCNATSNSKLRADRAALGYISQGWGFLSFLECRRHCGMYELEFPGLMNNSKTETSATCCVHSEHIEKLSNPEDHNCVILCLWRLLFFSKKIFLDVYMPSLVCSVG